MSSKKAEARARVQAMREEQARKDRARERMMRLSIAGAVLVAVAIIAVAVISNDDGGDGGADTVPTAAGGDHDGIVTGEPDAPVTLEVWLDFLCPHCQEFEQANGEQIDEWVDSGQVRLINYPVTYTGQTYSQRANNAYACAADEGMADEFLDAAFANSQQWTNNSLVDLGDEVGIGGDYESCVRNETYDGWSSAVTSAANNEEEVTGTPTVFVNGEKVEDWSPEALAAAVGQAATDAGDGETPAGEGETPAGEGETPAGDGENQSGEGESADSADNADGENADNADGDAAQSDEDAAGQ